MVIDWAKPLEAYHEDGRVEAVRLDAVGFRGGPNPDAHGDYWIADDAPLGSTRPTCYAPDGEGDSGWNLRNAGDVE